MFTVKASNCTFLKPTELTAHKLTKPTLLEPIESTSDQPNPPELTKPTKSTESTNAHTLLATALAVQPSAQTLLDGIRL